MSEKKALVRFLPNRVRRNYCGGLGIDLLRRSPQASDGQMPEDWIASMVEARNPGLEPKAMEGLSLVDSSSGPLIFAALLKTDPSRYLGHKHYQKYGLSLGFLAKLLDSSIRLHVQAHPTRAYAMAHLGSKWGKFECYYILGVRPGYDPYIRLGFQNSPRMAEWRRIIETQDISAMDNCFKPIPVAPGQVWFVPGGVPHAIGPGLTMIEVMEPSDLVVRCEFEREGIVVPPEARFMGRGLEACLDIFDYKNYPIEQVKQAFSQVAQIIDSSTGGILETLLDAQSNESFELARLSLKQSYQLQNDQRFHVGIITKGEVQIDNGQERLQLMPGDSYFAAASSHAWDFTSRNASAEVLIVRPLISD